MIQLPSLDDFDKQDPLLIQEILENIRAITPLAFLSTPSPSHILYHLTTQDSNIVTKSITLYEISETIIIEGMAENEAKVESSVDTLVPLTQSSTLFDLLNGRPVSLPVQACTIFTNAFGLGGGVGSANFSRLLLQ
jgi:hypothetical protein